MPRPFVAVAVVLLAACAVDTAPTFEGSPLADACPAGLFFDPALRRCGPPGCPAGTRRALTGCVPVGWRDCPGGFEPADGGFGCVDVLPAADCPPGHRPVLGQRTCAAVLDGGCPAGLVPDTSGWGCRDQLPATRCTGRAKETWGQAACLPVDPCTTPFPPANATHFVDAAFAAGQLDATHFRTVTEALQAAPANAVIAIAAGTYREALRPTRAVTLIGQCAESVTFDGLTIAPAIGLHTTGPAVTVEGVALVNFGRGGLKAESGGQITARRFAVLDAGYTGVTVAQAGSAVFLEDALIRDTNPSPSGLVGHGVEVSFAATASLRRTAVVNSRAHGLFATGAGSRITVDQSVVRATRTDGANDFGDGVLSLNQAGVTVRDSVLLENHEGGAITSRGELNLERVVIRDTRVSAFGVGHGAWAIDGLLRAQDVFVHGCRDGALVAERPGGRIVAERVVAVGTAPNAAGDFGVGLRAFTGAQVAATDCAFVDGASAGVDVRSAGTVVTCTRCVAAGAGARFSARGFEAHDGAKLVLDAPAALRVAGAALLASGGASVSVQRGVLWRIEDDPDGHGGRGAVAELDAGVALAQTAVVGAHSFGLTALRGALTLNDVVVRDTRQRPDGSLGRGFNVTGGGQLTAVGLMLLGNGELGGLVSGAGSTAAITRGVITSTALNPIAKQARGLAVQLDGRLSLDDVAILDTPGFGVTVSGGAASARLTQALIARTRTVDREWGYGLSVFSDASAHAADVTIVDSGGAGLVAAHGAGVTWARGLIQRAQVAVQVFAGVELAEASATPDPPTRGRLVVTPDSQFLDNVATTGLSALPLPAELTATPP